MDFPRGCLPLPVRRFPFEAPSGALPPPVPDCHSVRTAIPRPLWRKHKQPRCFPQQANHLLASFADRISTGNVASPSRPRRPAPDLYPHAPLKAGYTAHSVRRNIPLSHRITGSSPGRTPAIYPNGSPRDAQNRVSTPPGIRSLHAIGGRPDGASLRRGESNPCRFLRARFRRYCVELLDNTPAFSAKLALSRRKRAP